MTPLVGLGIAQILGGLFGNLFGARQQSNAVKDSTQAQIAASTKAAELQKQAIDDALNYQKSIDARDYRDWLNREARDRTDWEASETRKAPYRAIGDSAIRTLADYIRVPGMQPAQEVPVQRWSDPHAQIGNPYAASGQPTSNTMPVQSSLRSYAQQTPQSDPLLQKFGRRTLRDLSVV